MEDRFIPRSSSLTYRRPLQRHSGSRICRSIHSGRLLRRLSCHGFRCKCNRYLFDRVCRRRTGGAPNTNSETATPSMEADGILDHAAAEAMHMSDELPKKVSRKTWAMPNCFQESEEGGSQNVTRELLKIPSEEDKPRITHDARHLGPYCHHVYSTRQERQRRINAVHRSAASAKGLWKTDARYVTKRAALLAHVVGPILSGAETALHTDTVSKSFDQTIASDGRLALNGRASRKQTGEDGVVVYKAWTDEEIRRHWKPAWMKTEARVRILRWTPELSRRPLTHCQKSRSDVR